MKLTRQKASYILCLANWSIFLIPIIFKWLGIHTRRTSIPCYLKLVTILIVFLASSELSLLLLSDLNTTWLSI
jgi:hypothetical protein